MAGTNDDLHTEPRGYCGNRYCQIPDCLQHAEQGELYCARHLPPKPAYPSSLLVPGSGSDVIRYNSPAGLPTNAQERKATPIATGVLDYFPDALAAVAQCSWKGNEQHNPGQSLHWDRSKSTDEADALIRHFIERGTIDTDGVRHSAKVAWRALAMLQKEIESER